MYGSDMTTTNLPADTEAMVLQFLETASALERRLDRSLSGVRGVTFSEYRLLATLSRAPKGGYPRVDLANAVGLTASAVTRALKPLEKLGYVSTQRNQRDARQSLALITPGGLELLDNAKGVVQDILNELPFNRLSQQKITEFGNRLQDLKSL